MSEPIHERVRVNEDENGVGEFVVAGAGTALGFAAANEVLKLMSAAAFRGDTASGPLAAQPSAEDIGSKAVVGHNPAGVFTGVLRELGALVVLLAAGEPELPCPTPRIAGRRELGVQARPDRTDRFHNFDNPP